jgi:hypothetical protein
MNLAQFEPGYGLWAKEQAAANNLITWNDLIENDVNAKNDVSGTSYDYNYWSDYDGEDADEDGIGDTAYQVSGSTPTQDAHPRLHLIEYYEPNTTIIETETLSTTITTPFDPTTLIVAGVGVGLIVIVAVVIMRRR